MRVRFWGTRGSIPTPGKDTVRYGGNTACVEVRIGDIILILDAGSGIRNLGMALCQEFENKPLRAYLLVTHLHWDHIQGLPFFKPIYRSGNKIIVCGHAEMDDRLRPIFAGQMDNVHFPLEFGDLPSEVNFFGVGDEEFEIEEVQIHTYPLHHPGGGVAYRISHESRSLVFATDNEICHSKAASGQDQAAPGVVLDTGIIEFIRNADLAILDAQYTNVEYPGRIGWGHSAAEDAVEVALRAGVKNLALFHHDPERTDDEIDLIVGRCRQIVRAEGSSMECMGAAEGFSLDL